MKRLLTFALLFLMAGSAHSATTNLLIETFDRGIPSSGGTLDTFAADTEIVRRAYNTTASKGTGFIWGGYYSSLQTAGQIVMNAQNGNNTDNIQLAKGLWKTGSRAYTRFDTTALAPAEELITNVNQYKTPSAIVDGSQPGSKAVLMFGYGPDVNVLAALLVRDDQGWWESDPKSVTTSATPCPGHTNAIGFDLGSATWTAVDMTKAGAIDMDEVDSMGESALEYLAPGGAPHLDKIEGMGFICKSDIVSGGNSGIYNFVLGKMPSPTLATPSVAGTTVSLDWNDVPEASQGYNVYRNTVAGKAGTKLNASALLTSNYDDTTAVAGQQYYYIATTIMDTANLIEAVSNEAGAMVPLARIKEWDEY